MGQIMSVWVSAGRGGRAAKRAHDDRDTPAGGWCLTHLEVQKCTYTWTINSFSVRKEKTGQKLRSSTFSVTSNDNTTKWYLVVYPKGRNVQKKEFVSLFLTLESCSTEEVYSDYKFSIINENQEEKNTFQNRHKFKQGKGFGHHTFIRRRRLLDNEFGLLPDDTLTIRCEVSVVADSINFSGKRESGRLAVPGCRLGEELGALLVHEKLCDVTLRAGGTELRAHSVVLAARSPVFAAMFQHATAERASSHVDIADVDPDVLRELVHYMYTGRAPRLRELAGALLAAADKYALERLKALCEEALADDLALETAAATLALADLHSATRLRRKTIDFISASRATAVMATEGWRNMMASHPQLSAEVLGAVAMRQEQILLEAPPPKCARRS